MLPELFIVFFITLNEIKLNMLGLFYQIEEDIEILPDAFTRTIKGQSEMIDEFKDIRNNMAMRNLFLTRDEQEQYEKDEEKRALEDKKKRNQNAAEGNEVADL